MRLIKWFKGSYLERGRGGEGRERESERGRRLHVAFDLRLHLSPVAWTRLSHCSASPLLLLLGLPSRLVFPRFQLLLHWRELGPLRSPFAAPAGGGELGSGRGVGGGAQRAPATLRLRLQKNRAATLPGPRIAAAPEFGCRSVLGPITTAAAAAALEFGCRCPTSL